VYLFSSKNFFPFHLPTKKYKISWINAPRIAKTKDKAGFSSFSFIKIPTTIKKISPSKKVPIKTAIYP